MPIISIILGLLKNWRVAGVIGLALALLAGYGYVKYLQHSRAEAKYEAATAMGQLEVTEKKAEIEKEVLTRKGKINELEAGGDADGLSEYFNRRLRREDSSAPPAGDHRSR